VPFDCQYRETHGQDACLLHCPTTEEPPTFTFARVEREDLLPEEDPAAISVAVLDMHHGWPNLGHDAIVYGIQNIVCDLSPALRQIGMRVEVVSYDVRRGLRLPEPPGGRHAIYVGTGGPGHLDPRLNDGEAPGSQGIREDSSWEAPLFALFDAIRADDEAALLAVCHTFGVMCRWLGIARPELRSELKGGKSSGIVHNVLTDAALEHPWFGGLEHELADRRLTILDNRLYDLVPEGPWPAGVLALSYESAPDRAGEALTAVEVARDPAGIMPRILGVNHHPEIVNRPRQLTILRKRLERGAVTESWYVERAKTLTETIADQRGERLLQLTSRYMFLGPLRYHLFRQGQRQAAALGRSLPVDDQIRRAIPLATRL
jgi:hypothetical protein